MTPAEKLTQIAENIPKVYEAGKNAAYDAFWDAYQQNGERVNYHTGFAGRGWNEHTFRPKYDIKPTNAYMMFYQLEQDANIDLVKTAEDQGIEFDFCNCTNFTYAFYAYGITRLGVIDTRAANGFFQFAGSNTTLRTIEKLILKDDGTQTISNESWFLPTGLVNITIEGKLGASVRCVAKGMTKKSIQSFISSLYEESVGKTLTLSKVAVDREFETAAGLDDGTSSTEWDEIINTKPNWTISLV